MGSLGETLRQARLDRGASLADAELETHIRRKYLEALESEDFVALPGTVYARGFIRNYARYLGLDPDSTLDLYSPSRAREDRNALRPATPQLTAGRPVSIRLFTAFAGLVLIGLLLAYLWTAYNSFIDSLNRPDSGAVSRGTSASPSPGGASVATPGRADTPQVQPGSGQPGQVAGAPLPSPTPERGIVVETKVSERTWMEVWVDGQSQLQATIQGGTDRVFNANQSLRMRVGNAGAVQVTVNGEPRGPLGEKNQVKEFVWER